MTDHSLLRLKKISRNHPLQFNLPASKSISNRLLILQALTNESFNIHGLSKAHDTLVLKQMIKEVQSGSKTILNASDAGTAYRFMCALLSITPGEWVLQGTKRMYERPIKPLVDALISLGASIEYQEKDNFPPLHIEGKILRGGEVTIQQDMSSQFISALLLIAPFLEDGLFIKLSGTRVSAPYISMTINLLQQMGIQVEQSKWGYNVRPQQIIPKMVWVEKDWSAASYLYLLMALSGEEECRIDGLKKLSLQGDAIVSEYFEMLGISSFFDPEGVVLKRNNKRVAHLELDLRSFPDLAPAMAVTAAGLGVHLILSGLDTLVLKESNRLLAIKQELGKMGVDVSLSGKNNLEVFPSSITIQQPVETYNDHRIAMAFAPLVLKSTKIDILNPEVVNKSFPGYWNEIEKWGICSERL